MKKYLCLLCAASLLSCTGDCGLDAGQNESAKPVRFRIEGDFLAPTFTRSSLSANGVEMTDLWVFDFVDEECVQYIHQTPEDDDWGEPQLTMSMGNHNVCFVASRGDSPALDEASQTITWSIPRDAFWADKNVTVSQTSDPSIAVALNRVATKLSINVSDEIPQNAASIQVTPSKWYYGVNYWTGEPASMQAKERTIAIPASYIGTTGLLSISMLGISGTGEWTTGVAITAKNSDGAILSQVSIQSAPFKANRATEFSGRLFGQDAGMSITLNDEWGEPYQGNW